MKTPVQRPGGQGAFPERAAAGPGGRWRRRVWDIVLCGLTGVLTFVAFPTALAPEWTFFPLLWVSHVPLLWVLRDKGPRESFRWGLLAGTFINAGGYYWLAEMIWRFGHFPWPVAWLGVLLHSLYVGLMWGLWAWLMNRVRNTTRLPITLTAPLAMVAVEIAVPRIFPAYMGNSQYLWPMIMQICDVTGIYGVTFLLYRVNATLYLWLRSQVEGRDRPIKATLVTVGMMAAALVYGAVRMHQVDAQIEAAPKLKVGIAEADVGIFEVETRMRNHLLVHQQQTADLERRGAELVLWSESSYRMGQSFPHDEDIVAPATAPLVEHWREDARRGTSEWDRFSPIRGFKVPILIGATSTTPRETPRFEGDSHLKYYNSAILIDGAGRIHGRYDKNYLLIGGEYVPFSEYFPWIYKMIPALGDIEASTRLNAIEGDLWGKGAVRIGVLICYEGILPAFARGLGEQRPHFLVNMSNDDWFGLTPERSLHFALTVPRAIEHRRTLARPTLTGISAFVDPVGRVVATTAVREPETLLQNVPLMEGDTLYLRFGDVFAWLCAAVMAAAFGWGRWRRGV